VASPVRIDGERAALAEKTSFVPRYADDHRAKSPMIQRTVRQMLEMIVTGGDNDLVREQECRCVEMDGWRFYDDTDGSIYAKTRFVGNRRSHTHFSTYRFRKHK
jgi:hypothetical protein